MSSNQDSKDYGIYHQIHKAGLFDFYQRTDSQLSKLSHNNLVLQSRVNQFFFGTNSVSKDLNYLTLYRNDIVKKVSGEYYVVITNIETYLDTVANILNLDNTINCCPYNYYKTFYEKNNIPQHYKMLINTIDAFLKYLDEKDTMEAKNIRNIMTPNVKNNKYYKLETEVVGVLDLGNIYSVELILKFSKKGTPLFIKFSMTPSESDNHLTMSPIITESDNENFGKVYNYLCSVILMDSPKDFLICNLERVTGSRDFAELMVGSYLNRDKYDTNVKVISGILLWKSKNKEQKYIEYFSNRYSNCCNNTNGDIYINFEGVNKFLLNVSDEDLESFESKEMINEMYYNAMTELIYSFELLYKNRI